MSCPILLGTDLDGWQAPSTGYILANGHLRREISFAAAIGSQVLFCDVDPCFDQSDTCPKTRN